MPGLSTSWNAHRHTDGESLLQEIHDLGFRTVEFAPGLAPFLLAGLRRGVQRGWLPVAAVRPAFPAPWHLGAPSPPAPLLNSTSAAERAEALRAVTWSIDYASEFETPVVILDDWRPAPLRPVTPTLVERTRAGEWHSRRFVQDKLAAQLRRERLSSRVLSAVEAALDQLLPHARRRGVRLALSGAGSVEGVPSERELLRLMEDHSSGGLGYWHDFARTQQKANLGFLHHRSWLERMRPFLLGATAAGIRWPAGAAPLPDDGIIGYRELLPLLPPSAPLLWRVAPETPGKELRQALGFWQNRHPAAA